MPPRQVPSIKSCLHRAPPPHSRKRQITVASEGSAIATWLLSAWADLAVAGGLGAWFGLVAYVGRLRRANSERIGIKCLIADCLIASTAAEIALLTCLVRGDSPAVTMLAIVVASTGGQQSIDWLIQRWIGRQAPPPPPPTQPPD